MQIMIIRYTCASIVHLQNDIRDCSVIIPVRSGSRYDAISTGFLGNPICFNALRKAAASTFKQCDPAILYHRALTEPCDALFMKERSSCLVMYLLNLLFSCDITCADKLLTEPWSIETTAIIAI